MVRSLYVVLLFVLLLTKSSVLQAKEVLIVTWTGKTNAELAFEAHLKALVPGVKFRYLDAGRNKRKLEKRLHRFDMSNIDLVYSFGTTGTQIVRRFLDGKKPLVFNMVSSPVRSGLVKSLAKPSYNVTGAKFNVDLRTQIEILTTIKEFKSIGIWFDPREKHVRPVLNAINKILSNQGKKVVPIRIIPDSVRGTKMISSGINMANSVDVLYMIPSASFASHTRTMFSKIDPKVLIMSTFSAHTEHGATIAIGSVWEERGRMVAEQAARILGGANAGDIPVSPVVRSKAMLFINRDKMRAAKLRDLDKLGMAIKLHSLIGND